MIVFARAPLAGRAKTRLAPRLGAEGAARLQARLTAVALDTALAARCGPVELHATSRHAWLYQLTKKEQVKLRLQRGADLGERMAHAVRGGLRRARFVLVMGSDAPELGASELRRAVRWLAGGADAVLAPAHDGGYALIGLKRPADLLFHRIAWGSELVYAQTMLKAQQAGWRVRAIAPVADVDRPEDLDRLRWLRLAATARRCARRGDDSRAP